MPVMVLDGLLGCRIVLRYQRAGHPAGPPLSDLVGTLSALTADAVTVDTRRGPVTVARSAVRLVRQVAANRRDVLELARISRRGWRAAEQGELDGWLLSADRGWTGRANSVLPLRTPARPLAELLEAARGFYAARGLPLQIQLPMPARGLLDAELAGRCWTLVGPAVVLSRPLAGQPGGVGQPAPAGYLLAASEWPDADWLAGYHYRGGGLPEHAVQLLTRHDRLRFLTIRRDGRLAGIARGAVDEGWLGITAVEVAPADRRRGLGGYLMRQLADWGTEQGAHSCYLQVDAGNTGALALYRQLGFTEHHRYHYRVEPA